MMAGSNHKIHSTLSAKLADKFMNNLKVRNIARITYPADAWFFPCLADWKAHPIQRASQVGNTRISLCMPTQLSAMTSLATISLSTCATVERSAPQYPLAGLTCRRVGGNAGR
jgi:hypothetical protein